MRKQTKLVAVLSTAALLAIGASMTSFAAQGWAEEDGTWVYYDRNGDRVTDKWAKSGNNWYYLDDDGEMAIDTLIEDGDNYYYVDINGVMASNQWVAIENEDAGDDDEPDQNWYYFQANGKALTNGNNSKVALKTINGKKYAFDDEGKMLWGWVSKDSAEHIDNTDGEAFLTGDYYFGGSDDGAMTVGWLQMDITYDNATSDNYIAPVFNDDEDQTRWFYFQSNGKKVAADPGDEQKEKTINGKKYAFDENGAMTAEWSRDPEDAAKVASTTNLSTNSRAAKESQTWRWFQSVEDGSRLSRGWFKVVPAEYLDSKRYDDDEANWYYADGSGNLYAGEFKTIKGKKYAFRNDGRMVNGLKFINDAGDSLDVKADDNDEVAFGPFDTEDDFLDNASKYETAGYHCYYFGDGEDGSMKTGKTSLTIDGDKFNFYFETSGSKKGAGLSGEKDDKLYQSGMLLKAGTDEKYQVVKLTTATDSNNKTIKTYTKYADADAFMAAAGFVEVPEAKKEDVLKEIGLNKKADDIKELYVINDGKGIASYKTYSLVNTSGKIINSNSKNTDGSDYRYLVEKNGGIRAVYVED
ncbi:argininosuccinate lyase [Enterocloster citroniae]|uniref:argininosuccinate lyase n=1 Tax=Enterocloster citroniae TaxID=358743 RepID=UPI000E3EEAB7|nr:argininosuccinate lyase [Enterocloster citroniae]RGC03689.1 argininosuccinate lyase [Enterocloster citroniae]